jgi:hypothetical protein
MAKRKVSTKASRRNLLGGLPRPNQVTVREILVAGAVVAGLWFGFTHPARERVDERQAQLSEVEAQIAVDESRLAEYTVGQSYQGAALAAVVEPIETLLPADTFPGIALNAHKASAESLGLEVTVQMENMYREVTGDVKRADATFTVRGTLPALLDWFAAIQQFPQLTTFTTTDFRLDADGEVTNTVVVTVWASNRESLRGADTTPTPPGPAVPAPTVDPEPDSGDPQPDQPPAGDAENPDAGS